MHIRLCLRSHISLPQKLFKEASFKVLEAMIKRIQLLFALAHFKLRITKPAARPLSQLRIKAQHKLTPRDLCPRQDAHCRTLAFVLSCRVLFR